MFSDDSAEHFDRRSLLKKAAVGGAIVWSAPVVSSMRSPVSALAAGSIGCPAVYCWDDGLLHGWTIDNTAGPNGGGLWNIAKGRSTSPSAALHYGTGVGGTYEGAGANSGTVTSPVITLPAGGDLDLCFEVWREVETFGSGFWDRFQVSVIPAGVVLYDRFRDGGTGGLFESVAVSLAPWAGTDVQIVFSFDTGDGVANNFEGIWVDDVKIPCESPPAGLVAPDIAPDVAPEAREAAEGSGLDQRGDTFSDDYQLDGSMLPGYFPRNEAPSFEDRVNHEASTIDPESTE